MKNAVKIVQVQPEDTQEFSATHWSQFNQDQGWDFQDEYVYHAAYLPGGTLVGYAKSKIRGQVLELESLLVEKHFRRTGAGLQLITTVEDYARTRGCRKVILKTSEEHREAVNFYKKHGYTVYATLPNCYFGLDWYFFVKEL